MKQTIKKWLPITTIVTLLPMFIGLILWKQLPDTIATHFDFSGNANGWSSKLVAVCGMPLFLAAMNFIVAFAALADPKNKGGKAVGEKPLILVLWIMPVTSFFCCTLTYFDAIGYKLMSPRVGMLFVALVFMAVGNYLPKIRQNYFYGARLPWTLNNRENWEKTNRLTGHMMVLCGILLILESIFVLGGETGMLVMTILLIVLVGVVPAAYSFLLYTKANHDEDENENL